MASCVCVYAKTLDLILLRSCYADEGETEFRSHLAIPAEPTCVSLRLRVCNLFIIYIICKSGGYVIAPKSHLTAKKRHLSLSLIVMRNFILYWLDTYATFTRFTTCGQGATPRCDAEVRRQGATPTLLSYFTLSLNLF